ncbi:MAG: hypothetical protein METHP_01596 [Methanoregula sp. SKADARSKE-2]|nr:MAG: hypothetical protein METHP_01596 [Methanoregula sp. SKADARSKE-2]
MTEPAGAITVIPVRRQPGRIFLCRLEYGEPDVCVSDILYSTAGGRWGRSAGSYTKIRLAPDEVRAMLADAGFGIEFFENRNGIVVFIAKKP